MEPLWTLMRWAAEVVVNANIQNEWFYEIPAQARDFIYTVGVDLMTLFNG